LLKRCILNPTIYQNLSFQVWDMKAEENGGLIRLYTTLMVPHNAKRENHTWQVVRFVVNGEIIQHDSNPENLNDKRTLNLIGAKRFL